MAIQSLEERVLNGSLFPRFWYLWECPVCGKRVQSVGKPFPMYWEEDHKCSFIKLDRFGNYVTEEN